MEEHNRKYTREDVEFILKYRPLDQEGNLEYAYYQNISLGGVFIIDVESQFCKDALLEIELSLPYTPDTSLADALQLKGRVAYCGEDKEQIKKYNYGIEFVEMDDAKKTKLAQFLRYIQKTKNV
ncbi:PilZ domain-containing protein [Candidatus Auribacterota bacterium]